MTTREPLSLLIVISTICLILIMVMASLCYGLYHDEVDNKEIFAIFDGQLKSFGGALIAVVSYTLGRGKLNDSSSSSSRTPVSSRRRGTTPRGGQKPPAKRARSGRIRRVG
jgi:hypothetical protein